LKHLFLVLLLLPSILFGSVSVNVNGSSYTIPQTNERGWGTAVTSWIQAISANSLQPIGGSFVLTNDVDFGASYGLKAPYFLSRNTNPATAGLFRLNVTDYIGWRNNANGGNLLLGVDSSDNLTFNSNILATRSTAETLTNKTIDFSTNTLTGVASSSTSQTLTNKTISTANNTIQSGAASNGQVFTANGSGGTSWASPAASKTLIPSNYQKFTSGSGTYTKAYAFVITSGSATAGATYTNNGNTYTVLNTVASATLIYLSGTLDPTTSGTLTKASGTGDTTLTFTEMAKPIKLVITLIGGGAAGSGGSATTSNNGGNGTAGNASTFGTSLLTANGGALNPGSGVSGSAGGTFIVNSPAIDIGSFNGQQGGSAQWTQSGLDYPIGGTGGSTAMGVGGPGGCVGTGGGGGGIGAGGGGGGTTSTASVAKAGTGGGSGATVFAQINNPSATYSYSVGASVAGPAGGTGGNAGGTGGAGIIIVREDFQ
jgi:hypothetical protein